MEYFIFVQDDKNREKLVASSPSLEIARKTAKRMSNANIDGHTIVSALMCSQTKEGEEIEELEIYHKGNNDPEVMKEVKDI